MPRTYEYENPARLALIGELKEASKKNEASIWKSLAEKLSTSRKNRPEINLWKVNKNTEKGETIVVAGKVLSYGVLDHTVNVAAASFTDSAKKKIESAGGKTMTIAELVKKNPKGSGVKIIG